MTDTSTNTDPRAALRAAVAAESGAARRLTVAADRVHRAAGTLDHAHSKLERCEAALRGVAAENAKALERWVGRGNRGERPQPVKDAAGERARSEAAEDVGACERVLERLRDAETRARERLNTARTELRSARGRVIGARVGEIVTELQAMWQRERELMALVAAIGPADDAAEYLPTSVDEVRRPPCRPTIEDMVAGGHAVMDINTPITGTRDLIDRANTYWADYVAAAQREDDAPAPREAAA